MVSPGYSGVPYILGSYQNIPSPSFLNLVALVDPHKESGQSLYRQYAGKKGKIVLSAQWVLRCVEAHALQTYHNNFGGCKVTGNEKYVVLCMFDLL